MGRIKGITAAILLSVMFTESAVADTRMSFTAETESEVTAETADGEHTEEAIETTTDFVEGDSVSSPSAVEIKDNEKQTDESTSEATSTTTEISTEVIVPDKVLSESALDFVLDVTDIPDYAVSVAESDSMYSDIDESSKFYLNRYVGVREDTMTECQNNGLTIKESVPMALLMQRLNISYSRAVDMVISYESQNLALEASMEYREAEYEIGFMGQEEIKPELVDLLIDGYDTEEIEKGFAVSQCLGTDVKEIMTKDKNVIESNTVAFRSAIGDVMPEISLLAEEMQEDAKVDAEDKEESVTDEGILKLANEYCVKAEYIESYAEAENLSADNVEMEILAMMAELDITDESKVYEKAGSGIQPLSNDIEQISDIKNSSTYKEGPFNYKQSVSDNVDVGTGTLSYVDNVLSTPGINGLDLNINLMYFSKDSYGKIVDKRINKGSNWQYSFPFLLSMDGSTIAAAKTENDIEQIVQPMYVVLSDGTKYPIDDVTEKENRRISHCESDYMKLNCDFNSKGGADSCFELTHIDGTRDYFDKNGRWISTVNRFGNSIKVISYTDDGTTECLTIRDTLGKDIKITTTETANGYSQKVTRPDNTDIQYTYTTVNYNNTVEKTILTQKKEMTDSSKSIYTKYT